LDVVVYALVSSENRIRYMNASANNFLGAELLFSLPG
jgi:hypothetical protein